MDREIEIGKKMYELRYKDTREIAIQILILEDEIRKLKEELDLRRGSFAEEFMAK